MASKTKKTRAPLFDRLKKGLEEGIEFAKGKRDLRTTEVPGAPPDVSAEDVVEIRERMDVSQAVFAKVLNVSTKTVQSWEQGVRRPSQSALRLLQIIGDQPNVVFEIVSTSKVPKQKGVVRKKTTAGRSKRKKSELQKA